MKDDIAVITCKHCDQERNGLHVCKCTFAPQESCGDDIAVIREALCNLPLHTAREAFLALQRIEVEEGIRRGEIMARDNHPSVGRGLCCPRTPGGAAEATIQKSDR